MDGKSTDPNTLAFAEPYLQITCVDPSATDPALLQDYSRYYTEVHAPDVVRCNPGIRRAYRYELTVRDPRGAFGPKWLSIYEWDSRHGAVVFVVRGEGPNGPWRPDYLPEAPVWTAIGRVRGPDQWGRLMCNRLTESGPPQSAPMTVLMEAVNAPAGLSEEGIKQFEDFFINNHNLEIENGVAYSRVTKYRIEHLGLKPDTMTNRPQYLSIYEADAATTESLAGAVKPPRAVKGPADWENRSTAWQHLYRRVSGCIYPEARYTAAVL